MRRLLTSPNPSEVDRDRWAPTSVVAAPDDCEREARATRRGCVLHGAVVRNKACPPLRCAAFIEIVTANATRCHPTKHALRCAMPRGRELDTSRDTCMRCVARAGHIVRNRYLAFYYK